MHNNAYHPHRKGFRGVPVAFAVFAAATNPKCIQERPHSRRLTHYSVGLRWPRFQKPGFRKHLSNIDIHASLAVVTFATFSTLRNLLNLHLGDPKYDDFPFSIHSAIAYALLKLICNAFVQPRSFDRSLSKKISGTLTRHQPLLHAIRNIFVFVRVLPPIGIICKMCCSLSDIHSAVVLEYAMWSSAREKIPSDPVAGRVRGMVVGNRKHCPSHEIKWSYKRDGRW